MTACREGHMWAKTKNTESGMGPYDEEDMRKVQMVDHTGESEREGSVCVDVEVYKCCFESKIKYGRNLGRFNLYTNNCNGAMKEAVNACGGDWGEVMKKFEKETGEDTLFERYGKIMDAGYLPLMPK